MPTLLIHLNNEEPVLGEVENLPSPLDQLIKIKNPRTRDGKDLRYLQVNVTEIILPMVRVTFIEIVPGDQEEQIIGFVRE
jgi:hypothetical protein